MIVPQFWAEARAQHRQGNRRITVRRFGWSDAGEAEAQVHAEERAQAALQRLIAGENLPRREPRLPYNGADGVPIREEIVERHGDTLVTRNGYGARCLNTPDVAFIDIDFGKDFFLWRWIAGSAETRARRRIDRFLAAHPDWGVRLYRTPAGFRVLVTHRTFSPDDPAMTECFRALGVDPVYARMCLNQKCFRARVSAKPWRIGIGQHLRPRPGTWPVAPERLPQRRAWVERYENAARSFAACRWVETLGNGSVHPDARRVQELHDRLSGANTTLPLA